MFTAQQANAQEKLRVTIRLAQQDDVPTLKTLVKQSAHGLWQGVYDARQIESALRYIATVDEQLIADQTYYVAEVDGAIVGCGGWSRRRSLYNGHPPAGEDALDPDRDPAKIRAFYVHPNWARRGIGSRLLHTCEVAAAAAQFGKLELLATLAGEPLYALFGYQAVGLYNIELPDGVYVPTIKMEKLVYSM